MHDIDRAVVQLVGEGAANVSLVIPTDTAVSVLLLDVDHQLLIFRITTEGSVSDEGLRWPRLHGASGNLDRLSDLL